MDYFQEISDAIDECEKQGRLIELEGVSGLSGDKIVGFLQRCAQIAMKSENACYLELGVFQGLTLSSVANAVPSMTCFGIDDFSQFDADGENRSIVEGRLKKHTSGNGNLINADFEDALLSLRRYIGDREVALYFIDGPHDYRSQYLSLDFSREYLSNEAVIVVDDSNYEHVRRANHDWLKANPEFSLLYEAYTPCHPGNMNSAMENATRAGWWNGINIIVRDPNNKLERIYPPVDLSRERYFNDHLIHAARHAESAPALLHAAAAPFLLFLYRLARFLFQSNRKERFANMNTYSENLKSPRKAANATKQ